MWLRNTPSLYQPCISTHIIMTLSRRVFSWRAFTNNASSEKAGCKEAYQVHNLTKTTTSRLQQGVHPSWNMKGLSHLVRPKKTYNNKKDLIMRKKRKWDTLRLKSCGFLHIYGLFLPPLSPLDVCIYAWRVENRRFLLKSAYPLYMLLGLSQILNLRQPLVDYLINSCKDKRSLQGPERRCRRL